MSVWLSLSCSQNSQSIESNSSSVTVNVYANWNTRSYNGYSPYGSVTINGSTFGFNHSFNYDDGPVSSSGSEWIGGATVNVPHNSDGTKTVYYSAYYETHVSSGNISASGSKTLTTINRHAKLTSVTCNNDESDIVFKYSNPGNFSVRPYMEYTTAAGSKTTAYFYNSSGSVVTGSGTSMVVHLTDAQRESWWSASAKRKSLPVCFGIQTYIGSSYQTPSSGYSQNLNVSIVNASPTLGGGASVSDEYSSSTVLIIDGTNNIFRKGATGSYYIITPDSGASKTVQYSDSVEVSFADSNSSKYKIELYDSRGYSASGTLYVGSTKVAKTTYERINWKDHIVETPNKISIVDEGNGKRYAISDYGDVLQQGTPINADNLNKMDIAIKEFHDFMDDFLEKAYPIGSIYISTKGTNPGQIYGGTWIQIEDAFLLTAGNKYSVGVKGGGETTSVASGKSGNSVRLNTMPPYYTVYAWERTA